MKPLPWTNVYGLARSVLGFGTLLTLLVNPADLLFRPAGQMLAAFTTNVAPIQWSLFALAGPEHLELARWLAILVLAVSISGWRPRVMGLAQWYVHASFAASCLVIDGGDQLAAVLSLLLIPVCLTDGRKWHWQAVEERNNSFSQEARRIVAASAMWMVRLQVAMVYFQAATFKLAVQEWWNGTALYYWLTHPIFGRPNWMGPLIDPVLSNAWGVSLFTWGVLVLETFLFMALVMEKRRWPVLLALGLSLHLGIAFVHGLASFFFTMAGALILYLRPWERPLVELRLTAPGLAVPAPQPA